MAVLTDDRGVSTLVGYALNIGFTLLLVSALIIGFGNHLTQQRERSAATAFSMLGQQTADRLMAADRLAQTADDGTVEVIVVLPERVVGQQYRIDVDSDGSGGEVTLRMDSPSVSASVGFETELPVEDAEVSGGPLRITYDGTELVVDERE